MTTQVIITHGGPDHHDLLVEVYNKTETGWQETDAVYSVRLKNGESTSQKYVYDSRRVVVSEIPKE